MRRDGSSAFGPNNKYGYFPSGSIGWNISEEDFLKDSSWLNSLKVRASYGVIGNDKIRLFGFTSLLTGEATYDPGNATGIPDLLNGVAIGLIGNPNIQWEEQISKNFGLDTSLFNNKVSISADVLFQNNREIYLIAPDGSGLLGAAGSRLCFANCKCRFC